MKKLILLALLIGWGIQGYAQSGGKPPIIPPGCSNPVPGVKNPNCPDKVPIDGGLGILIAAGGAYAIKKLKDKEN